MQIANYENVKFEAGTYSNLNSSIDGAKFVCCYSSGIGIDALLRGKPIVVESPASFVFSARTLLCDALNESYKFVNRDDLFSSLSYAQWHIDEIRNGTVWNHYDPLLRSLL
jgi:hypothetical protein